MPKNIVLSLHKSFNFMVFLQVVFWNCFNFNDYLDHSLGSFRYRSMAQTDLIFVNAIYSHIYLNSLTHFFRNIK